MTEPNWTDITKYDGSKPEPPYTTGDDYDAVVAERDELQRRLDAVVAMLEVPTESRKKDGWLAYCENCWWRGEAEDANWGTDQDSEGYCPECGYEILEMGGDWSREESIHARAVAIAEGRDK